MAPRKAKRVVKTTKVVEETVEVTILGSQSQDDPAQVQAQPKLVQEQIATMSTTKTVPIEGTEEEEEEKVQETETQEPEFPIEVPKTPRREAQSKSDKIGTPPREEAQAQPRKVKEGKKEGRKKGGRSKKKVSGEGYKRYVFMVLKQVHPGMGISSRAMTVINNLMSDMFERLAGEASRLNDYRKQRTLTSREVQSAVRLVLPGDLGKHAIAEGTKAVSNYMTFDANKLSL